jgi:hypothetical protein
VKRAVLLVVALLALGPVTMLAQDPRDDNAYVDMNHEKYGPLQISRVAGTVRDPQGVAVPSVHMLLFTEEKHALVTMTTTDGQGKFFFEKVPDGRYRLVTKSPLFCPANVPLEVGSHFSRRKKLHLKLSPGHGESCESYGTLTK